MSKQQTAVEWFSQRAYELFEQYSEGKFDRITLNKLMLEAMYKAKEMEKERMTKAWIAGDGQHDKIADKLAEQWYEKTYGGNK